MTTHAPAGRTRAGRRGIAGCLLLVLGLVGSALVGCGGPATPNTVRVVALWTGPEETAFRQVLARFQRQSGITVEYTGGRQVPAALQEAVRKGNPPDVAVLSDPQSFRTYVAQHALRPLDGVLDSRQLNAQYPSQWLDITRAGMNAQYAVVVKASLKSLIWYDPRVFAARHYAAPRTWEELIALDRQAVHAGISPWCTGLESTSASGWPGTDWIEDILLHQSGPAVYQKWIAGSLPWTSPEIKQAWQRWGQIVATPGAINGGPRSALVTNFAAAGTAMFRHTPGCLMDHEASFIMSTYSTTTTANGAAAQAGTDFALAPFPQIDPRYSNAVEVGADLAGMFTDTPQAHALIAFLASEQAQEIWPSLAGSGALSVHTAVPLTVYRDPLSAAMARIVTGRPSSGSPAATTLSFDASDSMPAAVGNAFSQATLQYAAHPDELDSILTALDRVRAHTTH
jgi:alpha-glucoside transport system substrate-binding protein